MSKLSVAILYGGKSVEHQISINSAKNIFHYLDRDKFEPIVIGISTAGDWYLMDDVSDDFSNRPKLALMLSTSTKGVINMEDQSRITPDVFFPVLHGTDGEDGSIQGLLQAFEIPFAGTGVLGSAMAMNKLYTKKILRGANIPVSRFLSYTYAQRAALSFDHARQELGIPFMVKAANLGSSVGISKVKTKEDFKAAIDEAFKFDDTILLEEYVAGRELECSVMGNEDVEASLPAEIVISKDYDFYTYEAKYLDPNAVKLKIPAEVDEKTSERIRGLSIESYQALGCQDFARVDLFLKENGDILINEINTIPGFTNSSMFPMMWQERGIAFTPLLSKLIAMAMDKHEASKRSSQQYL